MKRTSVGEDHRDPFKFTHEVICLRTFQPMADFLSFAFCFFKCNALFLASYRAWGFRVRVEALGFGC